MLKESTTKYIKKLRANPVETKEEQRDEVKKTFRYTAPGIHDPSQMDTLKQLSWDTVFGCTG